MVGALACFWWLFGEGSWVTESVESGGMSSSFVRSARSRGKVAVFLLRFFEGFNGMTGYVAVCDRGVPGGPANRMGSSVGVEAVSSIFALGRGLTSSQTSCHKRGAPREEDSHAAAQMLETQSNETKHG